MTGQTTLGDACYAILVRCLTDIATDCPDLPSNSPPLHRLRNLVLVLSAAPEAPPAGPAQIGRASCRERV